MSAKSGTRSGPWSVLSGVMVGFLRLSTSTRKEKERKTAEVGTLRAFWLWDGKAATPAVSFTVQQAGNGDMTVSDLRCSPSQQSRNLSPRVGHNDEAKVRSNIELLI
ncbi:uncharacterized protein BO87DRAFT_387107 [Aspergillus neoniger CBS 115656]|uniref:Uncharacterized protein n=1 Tax=Aspergillus neoniger (strain CBS 115656) TaxID=1448310 RepID=A0A318YGT9_ASPNB|nr:hypothetical protein BO87DRAFT_387107 [Aspergillus neoniger CBS 115656]PYH33675.1 hypothetical protein BO87DRAFT_387107 [Aspergillus neoniger CBS 115656]